MNKKLSSTMIMALKASCVAYHNPIAIGYVGGVEQKTIDALVARKMVEYVPTKSSRKKLPVLSKIGWEYCEFHGFIGQGNMSSWWGYADMLEQTYIHSGGESWLSVCADVAYQIWYDEKYLGYGKSLYRGSV